MNLDIQNKTLHDMIRVSKEMKVIKSNRLYPFQKGLIISCNSLMKLLRMVKDKLQTSYILTYRLNQDGLEHFFGCIRQMGACHQHLSPVAFKHRIRAHILGKESKLLGSTATMKVAIVMWRHQPHFPAFLLNKRILCRWRNFYPKRAKPVAYVVLFASGIR